MQTKIQRAIAVLALAQLAAPLSWAAERFGDWYIEIRQGFMEIGSTPGTGNGVWFSCSDQGRDGVIYLEIGGAPVADGAVTFIVDSEEIEMSVWGEAGQVETDCPVCADNFEHLWKRMRTGRAMAVIPGSGRPLALSLDGAARALPAEPCLPRYRS